MDQEKGVEPLPTPQCSNYCKGSLWVALDYGHPTHFITDIKMDTKSGSSLALYILCKLSTHLLGILNFSYKNRLLR